MELNIRIHQKHISLSQYVCVGANKHTRASENSVCVFSSFIFSLRAGLVYTGLLHHLRTLTERNGLCGKRMEVWWIHNFALCVGLCACVSTFCAVYCVYGGVYWPQSVLQVLPLPYNQVWKIDTQRSIKKSLIAILKVFPESSKTLL